jgi:type IV pilus assembly protein PilE
MARARGFTLVEVVIAVAIVGILAAIALPSYRVYVLRANRTAAKTALSEVVSRQASYMADTKRYATKFSKLGWTSDDTLYLDREGNLRDSSSSGSIYSLTLKGGATASTCPATGSPSATAFTVVATPINTQAADTTCGAMCLSSVGIKAAAGADASNCWQR